LADDLPALVARAQKGDRAAFDKIVHCTARLVYAQIVAAVRDRHLAEDLAQETFAAAWKNIASVRSTNHAGTLTWLLTLARNKTLDALKASARKKRGGIGAGETAAAAQIRVPPVSSPASAPLDAKPTRAPAPLDDLPDDAPTPDQAAQHAEAQHHALQLLAELPEEYRRPLALRYLAGADYQSIRRALDLSDGALRGLLNRGMALLRERMSRFDNHKVPQ